MIIDPNEWEYVLDYPPFHVGISKISGGTVGKAYDGSWEYEFYNPHNGMYASGNDLVTNIPKTHEQAAHLLIEFLVGP